jgi:outer membrane protein TolC
MESISVDIANSFFDVYIAQMNMDNASYNAAVNDTLFLISKGRLEVGRIGENDLLQSELQLMNARISLDNAKLEYQRTLEQLKINLNLPLDEDIEILPPDNIPNVMVDPGVAVNQALTNRSTMLDWRLQRLEADRNLAQAKTTNTLSATLRAGFGLNQTSADFSDVYSSPLEQQNISVGFSIPLVQWGRHKSDVRSAESNKMRVDETIDLEVRRFEQDIAYQVQRFLQLQNQMELAARSDTIAQRRFEVAANRYRIGRIDITNLFIAQNEKDSARQNYIQTLRNYWTAYYRLRQATLYDFERNIPLLVE